MKSQFLIYQIVGMENHILEFIVNLDFLGRLQKLKRNLIGIFQLGSRPTHPLSNSLFILKLNWKIPFGFLIFV